MFRLEFVVEAEVFCGILFLVGSGVDAVAPGRHPGVYGVGYWGTTRWQWRRQ